jgi:uncharacterized protein YgbK (DUF1537 family)
VSDPQQRLTDVLRRLYRRGQRVVSAGTVAEEMWPDSRRSNTQGQTMHVGSGVAGRMLRRCRGVTEVAPRRWEIWGVAAEDPAP